MGIATHKFVRSFRRFPRRAAVLLGLAFWLGQFVWLAPAPAAPHQAPTPIGVTAVDSVGLTVSDMERTVAFFSQVLSFERVSEAEVAGDEFEHLQGVFGARARVVRMRLGGEFIELTEYLAPRGRAIPADSRSHDRWFQHIAIIVSDMDRAYERLREHNVRHLSSGPQRLPDWNPNAGGIKAFYFADPDGHPLEILQFPAGRGDPKWHQPGNKLFLGIDHTAIVIGDTDTSLRFYRDLLGMRVAGESENHGPEQERLNSVFGARLRITAMRAPDGPGVEFLQYLSPSDGRPAPTDARANDLAHWQTRLVAPNGVHANAALRMARVRLISSGLISFPRNTLGFQKGLLLRDPDGHAIQIVTK